jgi:hypothetical protein
MRNPRWQGILGVLAAGLMSLPASAATLKEASATFTTGSVASFLGRVSKIVDSGFGSAECDTIAGLIASMKPDDELSRALSVKHDGGETAFRIHVVMGYRDSPRIAFFASPELADRIQKEMAVFLDELDK